MEKSTGCVGFTTALKKEEFGYIKSTETLIQMYPIVGTIGYILPLCGEEKTTAKNFAKILEKREKIQQKFRKKELREKRKNTQKKFNFQVVCKILRKYMIICLV